MCSSRHYALRAFTLVELLVVTAIIALLISVLLPALSGARREAKRVVCGTSMRTLAQCAMLYAEDNQDWIPQSLHSAGIGFRNGTPWGYSLYRYVGGDVWSPSTSEDAFAQVVTRNYHCPFDERPAMSLHVPNWSYGLNVYFELSEAETGGATWHTRSRVPRPSSTVLFGEVEDESLMIGGSPDHLMAHFWTRYQAPPEVDRVRHNPGAGFAYLDGHAENAMFESTYVFDHLEPQPAVDRWNPATAQ